MDFKVKSLFRVDVACIPAPTYRNLQLNDPRIVNEYLSALGKKVTNHKLANKVELLHQKAIDGNFSEQDAEEYKTESMLHAESVSSRTFSGKYQWSPMLLLGVRQVQYWTVRLRKAKGSFTNITRLKTVGKLAGLCESDIDSPLSLQAIIHNLQQTRTELKIHQQ
jgi:hypothetical protein